jgi:lysophospholipase L1-like esterase
MPTYHINRLGFRGPEVTVPKPPGSVRVLMLGGSAVWSVAASSDNTTLPACLQRELSARWPGKQVEVINGGYLGYVTFQELLLHQLHAAALQVDVVVTFEGFNDFYTALVLGRAGENDYYHWLRPALATAMDDRQTVWRTGVFATRRILRGTAIYEGLAWLRRALARPVPSHADDALVQATAALWRDNLIALGLAARQRGERSFFFLQPALGIGGKKLTPEEQAQLSLASGKVENYLPGLTRYFDAARAQLPALASAAGGLTMDLTGIFDDQRETVFTDHCHFGDAANEFVARRMAALIAREFQPPKTAPAP